MVKRGWWGEKKGQGFYKRVKTEKGREILTLDYKTMEYRPRQKAQFASLEAAARVADPAERNKNFMRGYGQSRSFLPGNTSAP
jgi:3-hydroxyacyl-CoA dehydrogenase